MQRNYSYTARQVFFKETITAYDFRICSEQKVVGSGKINLFRSTEGNKSSTKFA